MRKKTKQTDGRSRRRHAARGSAHLGMMLGKCAHKLRLPFKLYKSGQGKPGRGSCWTAESYYPVPGVPYPGIVHVAAPTLTETIAKFYSALCAPNDQAHRSAPGGTVERNQEKQNE